MDEGIKETYSLAGEQVSVGEAVSFFEEEYLDTLPYEIEKNYAVSVSKIDVIQLANKDYAYSLTFAPAWKSIPYDGGTGEYISDAD